MRVHLVQNPQVRSDQLRVLGMGMKMWAEELRRMPGIHGTVSLFYHDENTVEITPVVGNPNIVLTETSDLFGATD